MSPENDIFATVNSLRICGYFTFDPEKNKSSTSDLNYNSVQQSDKSQLMTHMDDVSD